MEPINEQSNEQPVKRGRGRPKSGVVWDTEKKREYMREYYRNNEEKREANRVANLKRSAEYRKKLKVILQQFKTINTYLGDFPKN